MRSELAPSKAISGNCAAEHPERTIRKRRCSAVRDVQIRTSVLANGQLWASERAVQLIGRFCPSVPYSFSSYSGLLLLASLSAASFSAVAKASVALTFTSGSTPVPSQSPFVTGLMGRAKERQW
jgi:hypothetical protein